MTSSLITREASVVQIDGHHALVELVDTEGCGGCAAKSGCGVGLLGRVFRRRATRFRITVSGPLAVGDRVTLGLHPSALLIAAIVGFGLPLFGLLLGSALGTLAVPHRPDLAGLLGGLGGLLLGLALVRWRFRRSSNDARFQPVLLARH